MLPVFSDTQVENAGGGEKRPQRSGQDTSLLGSPPPSQLTFPQELSHLLPAGPGLEETCGWGWGPDQGVPQ